MDSDYKLEQEALRDAVNAEVVRYLGYSEDVHNDFIIVNEQTFAVDYQPRFDTTRKDGWEYYNVLDLIERKGLWFKPDEKAIEVIVQEHFPDPRC